jgi:hypothetical protein
MGSIAWAAAMNRAAPPERSDVEEDEVGLLCQ